MKLRKSDWLIVFALLLLLIGGVLLILYFNNQGLLCLSDPISYQAHKENTTCWCINQLEIK